MSCHYNGKVLKMDLQLKQAKDLLKLFLNLLIEETEFSPMVVMHPIFESAILADKEGIFNALEDADRFNQYKQYFIKERINNCKSVEDTLTLIRKSYKLTYLKYLKKNKIISLKECGNLLAGIWTSVEVLNHDTNVSKSEVLNWISHADKNVVMNEVELCVYKSFPEELTLYRGCKSEAEVQGFGWTIDIHKAEWFANRFGDGFVYQAKIDKSNVIAYMDNRNEKEVILDYKNLYEIERLHDDYL